VRWILDACSLISLVQSDLLNLFVSLVNYPIVIDTSVYNEVVVQGKKYHYPDADKAEVLLKKHKIPIIPIDISQDLHLFRDAGETSCFILGKELGITITSDRRAYKKFLIHQIHITKIEQFFFQMYQKQKLNIGQFLTVILALEDAHAISLKNYYYLKDLVSEGTK
jgi:predicted nucleic acid-binding protein